MLTQLDIDFKIDNNSRMMDSLGEIEEKLNELIAAKVHQKTHTSSMALVKTFLNDN